MITTAGQQPIRKAKEQEKEKTENDISYLETLVEYFFRVHHASICVASAASAIALV